MKHVKFVHMEQGDAEDYRFSEALIQRSQMFAGLPGRILDHLQLLAGDPLGYQVDRYTHSLQTATRAAEDGRGDAYVVAALLHDIGDTLAPSHHDRFAAMLLHGYVPDDIEWMVAHHAIFQGYYYWHLDGLGRDRNARDRYRGSAHFDLTEEFCRKYDQRSFDPAYATAPLSTFVPLVKRVFVEPRS